VPERAVVGTAVRDQMDQTLPELNVGGRC
jgi:hypothetical protein